MIAGFAATIHPEKPIPDSRQIVGKMPTTCQTIFWGPVDVVKKNHHHGPRDPWLVWLDNRGKGRPRGVGRGAEGIGAV